MRISRTRGNGRSTPPATRDRSRTREAKRRRRRSSLQMFVVYFNRVYIQTLGKAFVIPLLDYRVLRVHAVYFKETAYKRKYWKLVNFVKIIRDKTSYFSEA